ncbi:unnamed protein product [Phytophthora fragariaefolia]|uniref:Unnamed protein product n=1 Tax=Phytophthora fragariaefolia TaxID=1490495 RepID=A0A9W7DFJ8_9STRA|nr:unnamed protein product [Phytophthora fragariaefolia]
MTTVICMKPEIIPRNSFGGHLAPKSGREKDSLSTASLDHACHVHEVVGLGCVEGHSEQTGGEDAGTTSELVGDNIAEVPVTGYTASTLSGTVKWSSLNLSGEGYQTPDIYKGATLNARDFVEVTIGMSALVTYQGGHATFTPTLATGDSRPTRGHHTLAWQPTGSGGPSPTSSLVGAMLWAHMLVCNPITNNPTDDLYEGVCQAADTMLYQNVKGAHSSGRSEADADHCAVVFQDELLDEHEIHHASIIAEEHPTECREGAHDDGLGSLNGEAGVVVNRWKTIAELTLGLQASTTELATRNKLLYS